MHRVTGTIAPDPDGGGPLNFMAVRNTYDAAGHLIKVEKGELAAWQSEAVAPSAWTGFTVDTTIDDDFDGMDRKVRERVSGATGGVQTVIEYSYDGAGRPKCTAVRMNPSAFGTPLTDKCVPGPQGSDGPDRIERTVYNANGDVAQIRRAVGTPLEQIYVSYTYTANGKQATVTDANGNVASLSYDGLDRQSRWTFPSASAIGQVNTADYEEYGYDANGNRTSWRRRDGRTLTFAYDALHRVTSKVVPDGCAPIQVGACPAASATRDVYYGYDLQGHQLYARFDSASGEGISSGYDGFGRLTSSTSTMGGVSRTLSYLWDADGNRTRITHPDTVYFDESYDGLDRLNYAVWWHPSVGTVPFFAVGFDAAGRRSTMGHASSSTGYSYDPVGRLAAQNQQFAGGTGNVTAGLGYNAASQINYLSRDNDDFRFTGYVSVNRAYGANGLNQYTSAGPATFAYDANGDLISDGTSTYGYDAENRLIGSGSLTLSYDPLGRLWRTAGGPLGKTDFLYDGDQLAAEYDGDSGGMRRRYMFAGQDEPIMWDEGSAMNCSGSRFLHTDHQGSVVALADCWGNRTNVDSYDEYGIPAAGNWSPSVQQRFQYTGQAYIQELGMYYYKARFYSPTLGRFMQTDPIGYKDQMNLYAYVGSDPIDGRDPTGLYECEGSRNECRIAAALTRGLNAAANSRFATAEQRHTLKDVAAYLGTAGDHNGVTIRFGDLGKTGDGNLIGGKADASGMNITLNANALVRVAEVQGWKQAFITGVGTIGHETRHLQDGPVRADDYRRRIRVETRGYEIDSYVRQAYGLSSMNTRQIQNGAVSSCAGVTQQTYACQAASMREHPEAYH